MDEHSLGVEQVRTRIESQFLEGAVHLVECSGQFRLLTRLLQGRDSEDLSVFVLRVLMRQASEQLECSVPFAELQMELGASFPNPGVQVAEFGLPVRRARQVDVGKRFSAPLIRGRLEAPQCFEVMVGHIVAEGGSGTVFEAPRIDGVLAEIEPVAVRRAEQNAVSQLFAQTVDLDVHASGDTFGPLTRPQCFDDERCGRPGAEP